MSLFKLKNPFKHIFSSSQNENYEENKITQLHESPPIEEPELKTKEIFKELSSDIDYELICMSNEGNGFAIFKKKI